MAMSDAAKKQKLAEFAKKLDDKDDWTKRNAALIEMQKLITDPEEPLKLTSREIIALRVALFQQIEDLRSTIVRESCGLVAKMAELMPTEFEPSATMFLQVLLGRLHVSVKAMADSTDSCIRALVNHLSIKVMLPQIAQGSKDLKNTTLRRRCLEYTLLMLQLHGADAVQPFCEVFEEVLSRALGDASLECRSTARDILHLYHEYFADRAVKVVQSIDRTVRKTLELSFDVNPLLLSESADLIGSTSNTALNTSSGTLNSNTAVTITPDTPLSSSTPTSVLSPEPLSPASSPPSSPRSVRSVRSIQSAAPTTKPRDTKPAPAPSRTTSVSAAKKTPASGVKTVTGVKARPASVNLSSPKTTTPVTPVTAVTRSNSVSRPKDTPTKIPAPSAVNKTTATTATNKVTLAQVAKTTVTAKRAVAALTANKPPAKRLELPSLKAAKSTSSVPKSSAPNTAPSSPVAASAVAVPVRVEDSSEVLALKLHRLMERTRRSIVRDQLIVPHL